MSSASRRRSSDGPSARRMGARLASRGTVPSTAALANVPFGATGGFCSRGSSLRSGQAVWTNGRCTPGEPPMRARVARAVAMQLRHRPARVARRVAGDGHRALRRGARRARAGCCSSSRCTARAPLVEPHLPWWAIAVGWVVAECVRGASALPPQRALVLARGRPVRVRAGVRERRRLPGRRAARRRRRLRAAQAAADQARPSTSRSSRWRSAWRS